MKISDRIKENKIFFVTFGILMFVSFAYLLQKEPIHYIDDFYYPLYVVNYSCGLSSRLLVGSVFSLFIRDQLSINVLISVLICVYIAVCLLFSLLVNNYLKKTQFEAIGVYVLLMTVSPVFLSLARYMGIVDIFWLFFVFGSVWAVSKKGWRWLVPLFCVISLAIHEVFAIAYLPIIAVMVFYQFAKKPSVNSFIYIAVCALIVGAAGIYFFIIGDTTMTMTSDELVAFARDRLDEQGRNFDDYYIRSVLFWETPDVEEYSGFLGYIKYNFEMYVLGYNGLQSVLYFLISDIILCIPYGYLIIKSFRNADKALMKFVFLCSAAIVPLSLANLFISSDTERFSMHLLICIAMMMLFMVKEKDASFTESFGNALIKIQENKTASLFIGLSAIMIVFLGVKF